MQPVSAAPPTIEKSDWHMALCSMILELGWPLGLYPSPKRFFIATRSFWRIAFDHFSSRMLIILQSSVINIIVIWIINSKESDIDQT